MTVGAAVVLVVGGEGDLPSIGDPAALAGAVVVAADSGLHTATALGLAVDHLVGDLDSADPALVAEAERSGTTVHRHPADKDTTDSELAVDVVLRLVGDLASDGPAKGDDAPELLVLGRGGGRLDHLLADVLLLASPRLAVVEVTARLGPAALTVVRPGRPRVLAGSPGDQVSVLPVHGPARGVTTTGLRWALVDADLVTGTTRAVSNELDGIGAASVAVGEGIVVVVQPGTSSVGITPRTTPYDPTPRDPDRRP